ADEQAARTALLEPFRKALLADARIKDLHAGLTTVALEIVSQATASAAAREALRAANDLLMTTIANKRQARETLKQTAQEARTALAQRTTKGSDSNRVLDSIKPSDREAIRAESVAFQRAV